MRRRRSGPSRSRGCAESKQRVDAALPRSRNGPRYLPQAGGGPSRQRPARRAPQGSTSPTQARAITALATSVESPEPIRNQEWVNAHRGFESLALRQISLVIRILGAGGVLLRAGGTEPPTMASLLR